MQVDEGLLEVNDERALFVDLNDDVVDVRLIISPHLGAESLVHEPLEGCACILETERHVHITE